MTNYEKMKEAFKKDASKKHITNFKSCCGFHRVTVGKIHLVSITDDVKSNPKIKYYSDEDIFNITDNGEPYTYISLKTKFTNKIQFGVMKSFDDIITYGTIDFSPMGFIELYSIDNLLHQLDVIADDLFTNYNINIDTSQAELKSVEIAAEFLMPHPLTEYSRAFQLLKNLNHDKHCTKIDVSKYEDACNRWQSIEIKKSTYQIYVYDKTKELYEKHHIFTDCNIIKVELRIPETYNHAKCTGLIAEMSDDIFIYFHNVIKRNLLNHYLKWHRGYISRLNNLLSTYISKGHWVTKFINECYRIEETELPILLDYTDIFQCSLFKNIKDRRTKYRIQKKIDELCHDSIYNLDTASQIDMLIHNIEMCFDPSAPSIDIQSSMPLTK